MGLLISTVAGKMGDGPLTAMFGAMMPLIRTKLAQADEKSLATLSNIMAQAFEKVSDNSVSESEFVEWLKFD